MAKAGSACQLNFEQSVIDRTMTHDAAEDDPLPLYGVPEDRRSLIDAPPRSAGHRTRIFSFPGLLLVDHGRMTHHRNYLLKASLSANFRLFHIGAVEPAPGDKRSVEVYLLKHHTVRRSPAQL